MTKRIPKKQNAQLRNYLLIAVAIIATIGITAFILVFSNTDTTITLINDGECPQAALILEGTDGSRIALVAAPGDRDSANVIPGVEYEYTLSTQSEDPDEAGRICFDRDAGTFRPERGSNTDFVVESETRPFVVFEVDEQCPLATITLTSVNDDEREPIEVIPGESAEEELRPGEEYTYTIELLDVTTGDICPETQGTITLQFNESETVRIVPSESE